MKTTVLDTLQAFDAGVFVQKLDHITRDVALAVSNNGGKGKKGKVTIEISMEQFNDATVLMIDHKIAFVKPTRNGKAGEESTTKTPMHVGNAGVLTISPESQGDMFKDGDKVTRINHDG